jgi:hypothetical protein
VNGDATTGTPPPQAQHLRVLLPVPVPVPSLLADGAVAMLLPAAVHERQAQ